MIGKNLTDVNGRTYRVLREIGAGGQATVYAVREQRSGAEAAAKLAHPTVVTPATSVRLAALCRLSLSTRSPALVAPTTMLRPSDGVGAIQPLAQGEPLETLFENPAFTLPQAFMLAIALARAVDVLEKLGVAHGDLSGSNIFVRWNGHFFEVQLLDLDNAAMPGAPAPEFLGQAPWAAPELLTGARRTSIESDRFSLAVVVHQLLTKRHPFAAHPSANGAFDAYVDLLKTATWMEDPACARVATQVDGVPVSALSREIHTLFRKGLNVDPAGRPSADTWARTLDAALRSAFACDTCGKVFVDELTRTHCPWCAVAAPSFALHVKGLGNVSLAAIYTTLGRDALGGDPRISREHVLFRRVGFSLVARCLSGNGLAVQTPSGWIELKRGETAHLTAGTWLRFARGVEGLVCEQPQN